MWKSSVETARVLEGLTNIDRLVDCYGLSHFWEVGIPTPDYVANQKWKSLVTLLPAGDEIANSLKDIEQQYGKPTFYQALFGAFFHTELMIDWHTSNVDGISALLSDEIRNDKILFPHRYGRTLYDRFNDKYHGTRTDHLVANEVTQLLAGTSQGVYQLGNLLIGPLGVLRSEEVRFKPFSYAIPLWHCSDTGCQAVHQVKLRAPEVPLVLAKREIDRRLRDRFGSSSEWSQPLLRLRSKDEEFLGRRYYDLPELIAQCIVGGERTRLLQAALSGPEKDRLRETIASVRKGKSTRGSAETVAGNLGAEEQLQLLLIVSDGQLVEMVDEAVDRKMIRIPAII